MDSNEQKSEPEIKCSRVYMSMIPQELVPVCPMSEYVPPKGDNYWVDDDNNVHLI